MTEDTLNKIKARSLTPAQLAAEIQRLDHAKTKAARPREVARHDRKRAIYAAELLAQVGGRQPPPRLQPNRMSPAK